ncbi:MAG: hypothetical protein ACYC1Z_14415, partial [Georgenia sp.]
MSDDAVGAPRTPAPAAESRPGWFRRVVNRLFDLPLTVKFAALVAILAAVTLATNAYGMVTIRAMSADTAELARG